MFQNATPLAENTKLVFPKPEIERFVALYPARNGRFRHQMDADPRFDYDILAAIAEQADPNLVECRSFNAKAEFQQIAPEVLAPGDAIRTLASSQHWVMLRDVQHMPQFSAIIAEVMRGVTAPVSEATGAPERLRAFLFISSPGMLTPLHFDPEYNILFQISGRKRFAVYPSQEPYLSDVAQENYSVDGNNLLAWRSEFAAAVEPHILGPGDALYVPFKSPHWVRVGDEPSVSLSITWTSKPRLQQDAAWRFNAWLRKHGLDPNAPVLGRCWTKATVQRVLDRIAAD